MKLANKSLHFSMHFLKWCNGWWECNHGILLIQKFMVPSAKNNFNKCEHCVCKVLEKAIQPLVWDFGKFILKKQNIIFEFYVAIKIAWDSTKRVPNYLHFVLREPLVSCWFLSKFMHSYFVLIIICLFIFFCLHFRG